jgi:hypothetical protein
LIIWSWLVVVGVEKTDFQVGELAVAAPAVLELAPRFL